MKLTKEKIQTFILVAAMVITIAVAWFIYQENSISYSILTSNTISYEKAKVVEITHQNIVKDESTDNRNIGTQNIKVELTSGDDKGKTIEIENQVTTTHNIYVEKGQRVVIKVDAPENTEVFYSVYNYDRTPGIILIAFIFIVLMGLVGRSKGLKSVFGLVFTLLFICIFMIPMIYQGKPPIIMCFITVIVTAGTSMLLLNGFSKKTYVAVCSVVIGVIIAAMVFGIVSIVLHISGYNLEDAEELILIHQNTGLRISELLFIGIIIASLGAIMDMTISVAAPLFEIKKQKPDIKPMEVFLSGMNMGSDMIGTMCETLILAFFGTAITTILVVVSYGTNLNQFLSSDYIAIEIAHSIVGAIAVIVTVPVTSALCAFGSRTT